MCNKKGVFHGGTHLFIIYGPKGGYLKSEMV